MIIDKEMGLAQTSSLGGDVYLGWWAFPGPLMPGLEGLTSWSLAYSAYSTYFTQFYTIINSMLLTPSY